MKDCTFSLSRLRVLYGILLTLCYGSVGASASAFSLYDDKPEVTVLSTMEDFQTTVMQSESLWMIQFCTPTEEVCVTMAENYSIMAKLMKNILYLGVVDVTSAGGQEIANHFNMPTQQIPTLYWFLDDKQNPQATESLKDTETMITGGMKTIAQVITEGAKSMGIGVRFGDDKQQQQDGAKKKNKSKKGGPSATVSVTGEEDFEEKVILNPLVTMVAFTAPWCGHCKMLQPDSDEAAEKLQGHGAQLVWIDATDPANGPIAARFQVQGFPSILIFPRGAPKVAQTARQYSGDRKTRAIVEYVLDEVDRTGIPKEIPELINADVLKAECQGHNHICVLGALPHIVDSGASGRNHYRDLIAKVSKTFRGSAFSFLWFQGGDQPALETSLDLSFGFPALVAYSMDRHAFAVLRGSFSEKAMTSFLHGVTSGRVAVAKMKMEKVPKIEAVEPWDGEDAKAIEEEFDLADIMGSSDDDEEAEEGGAKEEL